MVGKVGARMAAALMMRTVEVPTMRMAAALVARMVETTAVMMAKRMMTTTVERTVVRMVERMAAALMMRTVEVPTVEMTVGTTAVMTESDSESALLEHKKI